MEEKYMRRSFAVELHKQMTLNQNIYLITGDLGYGMWDIIRKDYPQRFCNVGASEQAGADMCVGLSLSKKIPFFYSITPFLLYRCFETWRTYVNYDKLNVKLVGSGRDKDYAHDGFSHDASDAKPILDTLPHILQLWPQTKEEIPALVKFMVQHEGPQFISLSR